METINSYLLYYYNVKCGPSVETSKLEKYARETHIFGLLQIIYPKIKNVINGV